MARFIDDLRAPDTRIQKPWFVAEHLEAQWTAHTQKVFAILADRSIPVLLIDNVADYYYRASDQEYWDLGKDFPNLAPPYPMFWCEHKMPKLIHSKEKGDTDATAIGLVNGRVGVLVSAIPPSDVKGEGIPDTVKWILWCELFVDYGKRDVTGEATHGAFFYAIDAEGRLVDCPWMQTYSAPEWNDALKDLMIWFNPSLLAVSFLHCKNVRIDENHVPKPLAKKYHDRYGIEPTAYKTLVIEPLKAILKTEGGHGAGNSLPQAMHICRGHFRDYREGRGLFGKYHQLVWTPSVVRGTGKGKAAPPREIEVKV